MQIWWKLRSLQQWLCCFFYCATSRHLFLHHGIGIKLSSGRRSNNPEWVLRHPNEILYYKTCGRADSHNRYKLSVCALQRKSGVDFASLSLVQTFLHTGSCGTQFALWIASGGARASYKNMCLSISSFDDDDFCHLNSRAVVIIFLSPPSRTRTEKKFVTEAESRIPFGASESWFFRLQSSLMDS